MPSTTEILTERCSVAGVFTCPYLREQEIDDIQGCRQACFHPKTTMSLYLPEACPLDVCAEIATVAEQIDQAQRERVEKVREKVVLAHRCLIQGAPHEAMEEVEAALAELEVEDE